MKLSVLIHPEQERIELIYLYYLRSLKEEKLQKRGFIILPKSKLNNIMNEYNNIYEVVFPPIYPEVVEKNIEFFMREEINSILIYDIEDYKKKRAILNNPFKDFAYDSKELEKFIKSHEEIFLNFFNFFAEIHEKYKEVSVNIIPIPFGITSFYFKKSESTLELWIAYRVDLPMRRIVYAICAATVLSLIWNKEEINQEYWKARQFLAKFLNKYSILSEIDHTDETASQLTPQEHKILLEAEKESEAYLKKLGFATPKKQKLTIDGQILNIQDSKVYLTTTESLLMQKLIEITPNILSFDEIGNILWGDDLDKFSLEAVYKTISRIREKIRDTGYVADIIFTVRGKGVMLYY